MAHKQLEDGRFVIDWETGDPEGDRRHLMQAYHDFIKELLYELNGEHHKCVEYADQAVYEVIQKWQISVEDQVDDFPRIWIKRPLTKTNE
jgi:hypothetical protein